MMDPAWFAVGAALGVLIVWWLYSSGLITRDSAITSGAALVVVGIASLLTPRQRRGREDVPISADAGEDLAEPAREAAHQLRQETRQDAEVEVEVALTGSSPEEDLAAIGNQRRGDDP